MSLTQSEKNTIPHSLVKLHDFINVSKDVCTSPRNIDESISQLCIIMYILYI